MKDNLDRLVRRLQRGDMSVFAEIYELTYRQVYFKVIPILKDDALADDIIQDTYIKVLESIGNYHEQSFIGYLLTIARNLAINEYKRRKRTVSLDALEVEPQPYVYQNHLETAAANGELIRNCLKILDETERNVVLLHDVEGLKHKEIAAIIEKPLGTITWIYAKAIKKIRDKLRKEDWG